MKRLLIITSLFFSLSINAQTYIPFPTDSAVWTVEFVNQQGPFGTEYRWPFGYTINGDSLLNGLLYSKIYYSDSAGTIDPLGLVALTREQNKMVYCVYLGDGNQLPNEVVLYDYNLMPGDTFSFPSFGYQTIFIVDSVGAFQTFTGNRNAIYLSIVSNPASAYYSNPVWVEGIGDIVNGVIYHEVPWVDWWCEGLCFTHQATLVWSRTNSYCWLATGISEVGEAGNEIKCHPNPSYDEMTITLNKGFDKKTIEVFDTMGRKVFESMIYGNSFVLNKYQIGYGIFHLRVTTNSDDIHYNKIVFTD